MKNNSLLFKKFIKIIMKYSAILFILLLSTVNTSFAMLAQDEEGNPGVFVPLKMSEPTYIPPLHTPVKLECECCEEGGCCYKRHCFPCVTLGLAIGGLISGFLISASEEDVNTNFNYKWPVGGAAIGAAVGGVIDGIISYRTCYKKEKMDRFGLSMWAVGGLGCLVPCIALIIILIAGNA